MPGICGVGRFDTLSLWVELPNDLTRLGPSRCAEDVVVAPIMASVFLGLLFWRYLKLLRSRAKKMLWVDCCNLGLGGAMNTLQIVLLTVYLCAGLARNLGRPPGTREAIAIVSLLVYTAGALVITAAELLHDTDRGWELKCFWLLEALLALNSFRIKLLQASLAITTPEWVSFMSIVLLALTGLVQRPRGIGMDEGTELTLSYKTLDERDDRQTAAAAVSVRYGIGHAEETSSLLNRWTFTYMEPMIRRGMGKQLTDADLPPLTLRDSTEDSTRRLEEAWQKSKPNLWWAFISAFGVPFATVIPHRMAGDLCTFVAPMLLQTLLKLIEDGGMAAGKLDAVVLIIGIFLAKSAEMFLVQNYFHHCFRVGWRIRAGVTGLIMKKTLKLSGEGRAAFRYPPTR
ncbi:hypothetical protein T484DRAFT_1845384 [Baffinella frigidus]|nr:hypothetical protein T484DRAFT_1845384 [Cryptophyta sp. CCMP2293]